MLVTEMSEHAFRKSSDRARWCQQLYERLVTHNIATQRGLIKLKIVESTKVEFKEALQSIMKQLILSGWFDEDVEDLLDVSVYYFCAL